MDDRDFHQRLSRISTHWSQLWQAHQSQADDATGARGALMQRYCGAVYRYLLGIVRDPDVADDLAQEFAVRFLQGGFRGADPERGRFRDFLKMALRHLAIDHHRRQQKRPQTLPEEVEESASSNPVTAELDRQFLESWRGELLARAWEALAGLEQETGKPFHTVLRFRADHPEVRSAEMAERLGSLLAKPLTADGVRQLLHRAREKFAAFLLDDVAQSLQNPSNEELEQELIDLNLLEYCRPDLERRKG